MERIPVTQARAAISDVVSRVHYQKERVVLTRQGRDIAVIIPIEDLPLLEKAEYQAATGEKPGESQAESKISRPLDEVKKELGLL